MLNHCLQSPFEPAVSRGHDDARNSLRHVSLLTITFFSCWLTISDRPSLSNSNTAVHKIADHSPFDALANELIVIIFLLVAATSQDPSTYLTPADTLQFRRSARLVCRRWNEVVQSHPKLEVWASWMVNTSADWPRFFESVAIGPCLVRLEVDSHWFSVKPDPLPATFLSYPLDKPVTIKGLNCLVSEPTLIVLEALGHRLCDPLESTRYGRELLELELSGDHGRFRLHLLPPALNAFSTIERLKLTRFWLEEIDESLVGTTRITLPLLHALLLDQVSEYAFRILDALEAPELGTLAIQTSQTDASPVALNAKPLQHQHPSIHTVVLYGFSNRHNLSSVLSAVPNVVNLHMGSQLAVKDLQWLRSPIANNSTEDGGRGVAFPYLETLQLEGTGSIFRNLPWALRGRPQKLRRCWLFVDFGAVSIEGTSFGVQERPWLMDNAGFCWGPAEAFTYEAVVGSIES